MASFRTPKWWAAKPHYLSWEKAEQTSPKEKTFGKTDAGIDLLSKLHSRSCSRRCSTTSSINWRAMRTMRSLFPHRSWWGINCRVRPFDTKAQDRNRCRRKRLARLSTIFCKKHLTMKIARRNILFLWPRAAVAWLAVWRTFCTDTWRGTVSILETQEQSELTAQWVHRWKMLWVSSALHR